MVSGTFHISMSCGLCFAAIFVSECGPLPVLGNPLLGLVIVFSNYVEIRKLENVQEVE